MTLEIDNISVGGDGKNIMVRILQRELQTGT